MQASRPQSLAWDSRERGSPFLAVYWQTDFLDPNGAMPSITATDSSVAITDAQFSSGKVGVNVFDGRAAYQDLVVTPL